MAEGRRRRRVGVVVGGHEDGLQRRDRALLGRGDALLQPGHLGRQVGLVADRRRHPAEQRRHLRAGLGEAEDVVDEEQHVAALVAEVLGHGQAGQADAQAGAGRLVHLAEDHDRLGEHARLGHLVEQVVALARALADAGEDGIAAVLLGDVADELLDDDRLAHAGAAEDADLAALGEGRDQVDDLEAGLEDLGRGRLVLEGRAPPGGSGSRSRASTGPFSSMGWPSTSKTRPSVTGPTGTVIGAPVSTAFAPRARPSVVVMATARTQLLPRCCWTSHTSGRAVTLSISTALKMAGSCPAGNSMSTTGPVIGDDRAGRVRSWGLGYCHVTT